MAKNRPAVVPLSSSLQNLRSVFLFQKFCLSIGCCSFYTVRKVIVHFAYKLLVCIHIRTAGICFMSFADTVQSLQVETLA